jgi:hypothetical protein
MTQRNEGSNCRGAACQTSRWAGVDECTRPNVFRKGQLANLVGAANGSGAPWTGCWQLAPKGTILQAFGSRVTGPAAVMAGHAGGARMRVRIAKVPAGQAGRVQLSAVHPTRRWAAAVLVRCMANVAAR